MTGKDQLPVFFANLDFFGGSAITKDVIFPFSTSAVLMGGDPGISSNLVLVLRVVSNGYLLGKLISEESAQ
jgi:hypothetical protein